MSTKFSILSSFFFLQLWVTDVGGEGGIEGEEGEQPAEEKNWTSEKNKQI